MPDKFKPKDIVHVTAADPRTRITGIVQRKVENCDEYIIQWADGDTSAWRADRLSIHNAVQGPDHGSRHAFSPDDAPRRPMIDNHEDFCR